VGAWIETIRSGPNIQPGQVAPCVGAWIETKILLDEVGIVAVAPCVGAWIETSVNGVDHSGKFRRALRGRVD